MAKLGPARKTEICADFTSGRGPALRFGAFGERQDVCFVDADGGHG
jgi:hypothetical protein